MSTLRKVDAVLVLVSACLSILAVARGDDYWATAFGANTIFCAASYCWCWADRMAAWSRKFIIVSAFRRMLGG